MPNIAGSHVDNSRQRVEICRITAAECDNYLYICHYDSFLPLGYNIATILIDSTLLCSSTRRATDLKAAHGRTRVPSVLMCASRMPFATFTNRGCPDFFNRQLYIFASVSKHSTVNMLDSHATYSTGHSCNHQHQQHDINKTAAMYACRAPSLKLREQAI
jgi:hypothetical protein